MYQAEKYFNGERLQCMIGIAVALLSVIVAIYFLKVYKTPFYKGFAWPFIILPVLLLIICVGVVFKSPGDIKRVKGFLESGKEQIRTQEIPRMEKVMRNFNIIKMVELSLMGASLLLLFLSGQNFFLKGIASGIVIQAILLFIFDVVAEARGKVYSEFLNSI